MQPFLLLKYKKVLMHKALVTDQVHWPTMPQDQGDCVDAQVVRALVLQPHLSSFEVKVVFGELQAEAG